MKCAGWVSRVGGDSIVLSIWTIDVQSGSNVSQVEALGCVESTSFIILNWIWHRVPVPLKLHGGVPMMYVQPHLKIEWVSLISSTTGGGATRVQSISSTGANMWSGGRQALTYWSI